MSAIYFCFAIVMISNTSKLFVVNRCIGALLNCSICICVSTQSATAGKRRRTLPTINSQYDQADWDNYDC